MWRSASERNPRRNLMTGDDNPYLAPAAEIVRRPHGPEPSGSWRQAAWRGGKTGLKWVTYIFGPICALSFLGGLGFVVFSVVYREGLLVLAANPVEYLKLLGNPFAGFILCTIYGFTIGGVIGALSHLLRRPGGRSRKKPS